MKAVAQSFMQSVWYYKLAIAWGILFTIQSVGTIVLAAMVNVNWSELDTQGKFLLLVGMSANWAGMMMAFLSRVVSRLSENKPIMDIETDASSTMTKTTTTTETEIGTTPTK
jgi:hypothetical protein